MASQSSTALAAAPGETARIDGRIKSVFTVEELAERWEVNPRTIYAMIERKEILAVRVGRLVRIARFVIERFESQGCEVPGGK